MGKREELGISSLQNSNVPNLQGGKKYPYLMMEMGGVMTIIVDQTSTGMDAETDRDTVTGILKLDHGVYLRVNKSI